MASFAELNRLTKDVQNDSVQNDGTVNDSILNEIKMNGYAIVPGVFSPEKVEKARHLFYEWIDTVPHVLQHHIDFSFQGLMKYAQIGHQKHTWFVKTDPCVQKVFKDLWNTDELVTGFDGTCWIPSSWNRPDVHWVHTDQAACAKGLQCIQGYVSLTSNVERSFVVYEGSHLLHEPYMTFKGYTGKNNWRIISGSYLDPIQPLRKVLTVNAGDMVLWDSRTFHQNQYGSLPEERLVQYVCFLPRDHLLNTPGQRNLRRKYYEKRRTTSHWPYPLSANPQHPEEDLYVPLTDLSEYDDEIRKLL